MRKLRVDDKVHVCWHGRWLYARVTTIYARPKTQRQLFQANINVNLPSEILLVARYECTPTAFHFGRLRR